MQTTHAQLVDDGLAKAAQAGDPIALSQLYDRYMDPLYRFVFRHVNHVQDAEDLTSDIMLRMVNHLPTFQRASSFRTWIYAIARHAVADFWRSRYRMREELVAEFSGVGAAVIEEDAVEADDTAVTDRARAVFEKLPEQYRTVLTHRFVEQRTVAETAKAMATSPGNVKVMQHRALKKAALIAKEIV
jgi:RNA polymerase sigma-70 factor (ECF subfamily)